MQRTNKKGQASFGFEGLIAIVLILGVAGIITGFVQNISTDVGGDTCPAGFTTYSNGQCQQVTNTSNFTTTESSNASYDGQLGVANVSGKFPILGLLGAAIVIIGALFLLVRFTRKS